MLVQTNKPINSALLEVTINKLTKKYPFLNLLTIGYSRMGKPIYSLILGHGNKSISINAAHHANEWITSIILLRFIEECAESYNSKNIPPWAENITLHFIPMVNPDGIDLLAQDPIKFKDWKANIIGVDLNSNYPANWEKAKLYKYEKGYTQPGPRDYVGEKPLSEPETCAMVAYTETFDFDLTLSLHTQGEVIYWLYEDYMPIGAEEMAKKLSTASGYELEEVPDSSSHGGYRDWFIKRFNRPGFTIECGFGENPLPIEDFDEIYEKVKPLLWQALT